jgi:hypothetical protein
MKNIFLILISLLSLTSLAQFPIIEEFNAFNGANQWTTCCGAGLQNYGGSENYATFNIGNTPYPNSSNITITSPVASYTTCLTNITVSFPLAGRIENGFDFMRFQYWNGASWITVASYTGSQNATYSYSLPNTITRFRFLLQTDNSVNTYNFGTSVYYYDITRFTVSCTSVLPIELISFESENKSCGENIITWKTATEVNNNYVEIERSFDAINFESIKRINSTENSYEIKSYNYKDESKSNGYIYFRLKQVDLDGTINYSNISSVYSNCGVKFIIKTTNLLGQEVAENFDGYGIIFYSDGSVEKKIN